MEPSVIVMIVTLALPNGDASVEVKPMETAQHCKAAADIEASDPFVASVECSELHDGRLELKFQKRNGEKSPETAEPATTG
jgi:hypothetical protein